MLNSKSPQAPCIAPKDPKAILTFRAKPQEPFRWPSVAEASRKAIDVRYRLLPYWETLFAQASKTGT